jgi:hypothetical protein
MASIFVVFAFSATMIISGAFISVFSKVMYKTKAKNIDGEDALFEKPWFQDWAMVFFF